MSIGPKLVTALLLFALVPVAAFAVGKTMLASIALVNVVLVFVSLYVMFSPSSEDHEAAHAAAE
ncbi:MAG: hypothetical protein ABEK02_06035 [Haloquadratum sp.]